MRRAGVSASCAGTNSPAGSTREARSRRSRPSTATGTDFATFYDFPAEHRIRLRPSKPVESIFAGTRIRMNVATWLRRRGNALGLAFQGRPAARARLGTANGGLAIMTLVLRGEQFVDGIYVP
jgi:hypothetical protein